MVIDALYLNISLILCWVLNWWGNQYSVKLINHSVEFYELAVL